MIANKNLNVFLSFAFLRKSFYFFVKLGLPEWISALDHYKCINRNPSVQNKNKTNTILMFSFHHLQLVKHEIKNVHDNQRYRTTYSIGPILYEPRLIPHDIGPLVFPKKDFHWDSITNTRVRIFVVLYKSIRY